MIVVTKISSQLSFAIARASIATAIVVTEAHFVLPVRTDGVTTAVLVGNGILTMTFSAKRVGSNCKISAAECGPPKDGNTTHLGFEFDVDFQTRASVFFDYRGHLEGQLDSIHHTVSVIALLVEKTRFEAKSAACVEWTYFINMNSPSGGTKEIVRSLSNLPSLTH